MRKLYERYIKIPNDAQISDSVLKSRILLSAIAILACLTIMLSTAFAFFSTNFKTDFSTMVAATWDVYGSETAVEGEVHAYTLSSSGTATEGYCIITVTDKANKETMYYTGSFREEMTIKIQMTPDCKVDFDGRWGNPSKARIISKLYKDGDTIQHSFTPEEPSNEKGKTGSAVEATGKENTSLGASGGTAVNEPDTSSNKTEESGSTKEPGDSSASSEENKDNTSAENSSSASDKDASSTENGTSSESSKENETTSTPAQSTSDGGPSASSGDTPSNAGASSESSSATDSKPASSSSSPSESSSATDSKPASSSSSASGGGETASTASAASSGDAGSEE